MPDITDTDAGQLPLVTVLTPTYNRRDFLGATLASIRYQAYPRVEHIVLDGGSTDGTVDLLRHAQERWGVQWVSRPDGGMYEAINSGLGMANGRVVGWVNSDDWLLPWTLSAAVETMASYPRPCAVFGDALSVPHSADEATFHIYSNFSRRALTAGKTLAQTTVFWPKEASSRVGELDTMTYRQIADCDYWIRLSEVLPFVKIREFLAVAQNHPDTKRQSLRADIDREFERLIAAYNSSPAPSLVRRANVLSERMEWLQLLRRKGWQRSYESPLLELSWEHLTLRQNLRRSGPWRRHPLQQERVSLRALREELSRLERELL